jgi:hypothetical protein
VHTFSVSLEPDGSKNISGSFLVSLEPDGYKNIPG